MAFNTQPKSAPKATRRAAAILKRGVKQANSPKTVDHVWDLWRDGVTQSFIRSFQECRHQTWLRYVEGWTGTGVVDAIELGNVFHHLRGEEGKKTAVKALADYKRKFVLDTKDVAISPADLQSMNRIHDMGMMLFEETNRYWDANPKWQEYIASGIEILSREETFRIPYVVPAERIRIPMDLRDADRTIWLTGKMDTLFRRQTPGRKIVKVWETKTKSQVAENLLRLKQPIDRQANFYCVAASIGQRLSPEKYGGIDEPITGWIYDVIKTPSRRQKKDETDADFIERCRQDYRDKPREHFFRFEQTLAPNSLAGWRRSYLDAVLAEIIVWWEAVKDVTDARQLLSGRYPHWLNDEALVSHWGRPCELFYAITQDRWTGLYQRSKPFPEL